MTPHSRAFEDLTDYEVDILRILGGEDLSGWSWGAAMGACCEHLKEQGYARGSYEITDKGKELLKRYANQQE